MNPSIFYPPLVIITSFSVFVVVVNTSLDWCHETKIAHKPRFCLAQKPFISPVWFLTRILWTKRFQNVQRRSFRQKSSCPSSCVNCAWRFKNFRLHLNLSEATTCSPDRRGEETLKNMVSFFTGGDLRHGDVWVGPGQPLDDGVSLVTCRGRQSLSNSR